VLWSARAKTRRVVIYVRNIGGKIMTTNNIDDPNVMTAMILSDGVIKGLEGAHDALKSVIYRDENAMVSLIASLARLRMVEAMLLKSAAETSGQEVSFFAALNDKVGTAILLHCLVAKTLSIDDARGVLDNDAKFEKLLPTFTAAYNKGEPGNENNIAAAVSNLNAYLSKN